MSDIEQKLKTLPEKPGVYIMRGIDDEIIYIGKAKVLKNRVRQYFKGNNHSPKVRAMVDNIKTFEYIIADSELEALILENNLIKKHMPKYNILLKDDKTYPFVKVTLNEDFPRIFITRKVYRDGARYFGPYQSSMMLHELMDLIKEIFKVRCCNKAFDGDFSPSKPCLYYHLGKCHGVCNKSINKEKYREIIQDVCAFLGGKYDKVLKSLNEQMDKAAKNLDFEKAAVIRDRIKSVQSIGDKQKIVTANGNDIDAVAVYNENNFSCIEIFFIRSGNMLGKEHYFINDTDGIEGSRIISEFLVQYYDSASFMPREVLTQYELEDESTLSQWLSKKAGRNVNVRNPKIGEHVKLINMIKANAKKEHSEYELKRMRANDFVNNALSQLTDIMNLDNPPMLIEAYDISNISGTSKVGAMVTFKNGKNFKDGYRNFKIKNIDGQDDYACMQEVLTRRFNQALGEQKRIKDGLLQKEKAKFAQLPDVVLVDGGAGHVGVAKQVFDTLGINIPVFGIVKDSTHSTRGLVSFDKELSINPGSEAFMLLTNIQDEMHRRAITYHRNIRNTKALESELLSISGVGQTRRKALLSHFGTVGKIKKATVDELISAKGIDISTAKSIYEYFHKEE